MPVVLPKSTDPFHDLSELFTTESATRTNTVTKTTEFLDESTMNEFVTSTISTHDYVKPTVVESSRVDRLWLALSAIFVFLFLTLVFVSLMFLKQKDFARLFINFSRFFRSQTTQNVLYDTIYYLTRVNIRFRYLSMIIFCH